MLKVINKEIKQTLTNIEWLHINIKIQIVTNCHRTILVMIIEFLRFIHGTKLLQESTN